MPFKSEKQRRWMYANKPEMAARWSAEEEHLEKKKKKKKKRKSVEGAAKDLAAQMVTS